MFRSTNVTHGETVEQNGVYYLANKIKQRCNHMHIQERSHPRCEIKILRCCHGSEYSPRSCNQRGATVAVALLSMKTRAFSHHSPHRAEKGAQKRKTTRFPPRSPEGWRCNGSLNLDPSTIYYKRTSLVATFERTTRPVSMNLLLVVLGFLVHLVGAKRVPGKSEFESRGIVLLDAFTYPVLFPSSDFTAVIGVFNKNLLGNHVLTDRYRELLGIAAKEAQPAGDKQKILFGQIIVNGAYYIAFCIFD